MAINDPSRTQPPHLEEGPGSSKDPLMFEKMGALGDDNESLGYPEEEGEDETGAEEGEEVTAASPEVDWLRRAREANLSSTTYVDSNYRKNWEDSLRAFNNQHPAASKYNSPSFDKRSRVFRPKVRSVIRKNEAAAAAAYFSNMDVVSVEAENQSDPAQLASAEIMKHLLQYRLTKSIPWFQTVVGGLQDAQTVGVAVAHAYWKYNEKEDQDRPCIDLLPVENCRFDPAASWTDPVNTSPYWIQLIPMFLCDVHERMEEGDGKTRRWRRVPDSVLKGSTGKGRSDSTRQAREENRENPYDRSDVVSEYDVVWIQRHIHRYEGRDWEFYCVDAALLTDAVPLSESVFHGRRPYVMGCCILETHKTMPSSVPQLASGLTEMGNEVINQRLDNVKFVLNKAYMVKRGANVDTASLVRNVPGRVTMVNDPEKDVKESSWPDVTQSAYIEQDRINSDFDELTGNFSSASIQMTQRPNQPARSMQMLAAPANSLTEYLLRTYTETFVQPLLYQLVLLEQYYETDQTVLAIAANQAKLFQRFGVDRITDQLLMRNLTVIVNVGMGATDPQARLQKFLAGMTAFANMAKLMPPGVNLMEIAKEVFGHLGYQNGQRFFSGQDPQVLQLQQQVKQLMGLLQQAGAKIKDKSEDRAAKARIASEKNVKDIVVQRMKHGHENRRMLAEAFLEQHKQATQPPTQAQQAPSRRVQ